MCFMYVHNSTTPPPVAGIPEPLLYRVYREFRGRYMMVRQYNIIFTSADRDRDRPRTLASHQTRYVCACECVRARVYVYVYM